MSKGRLLTHDEVGNLRVESWSFSPLALDEGDKAWQYFEFATADLNDDGGSRSLVNAVSNCKRALHFRLGIVAEAFGIAHASSSTNYTFPQLFDFVGSCGVTSPRVLRKLNQVRNQVEHQYVIPDKQQAEDFADVIELFLYATDRLVKAFPDRMELRSFRDNPPGMERQSADITVEPGSGTVNLKTRNLMLSDDELQQKAETELANLKHELKNGKKPTDDFLYSEKKPELTAYRRATYDHWEDCDSEFSVKDGKPYFEWIALLLKMHRSDYM